MDQKVKSTPTPWAWTEGTPTITRKWNGKENPVATVNGSLAWHEDNLCSAREAGANAALIVRAVNRDHHFDALVKALEMARARIEYLGATCSDPRHFQSNADTFLPKIDAVLSDVGIWQEP